MLQEARAFDAEEQRVCALRSCGVLKTQKRTADERQLAERVQPERELREAATARVAAVQREVAHRPAAQDALREPASCATVFLGVVSYLIVHYLGAHFFSMRVLENATLHFIDRAHTWSSHREIFDSSAWRESP